ncbi:hypothetical protein GGI11_008891, partial [Coemansia sp. RSA 2049]
HPVQGVRDVDQGTAVRQPEADLRRAARHAAGARQAPGADDSGQVRRRSRGLRAAQRGHLPPVGPELAGQQAAQRVRPRCRARGPAVQRLCRRHQHHHQRAEDVFARTSGRPDPAGPAHSHADLLPGRRARLRAVRGHRLQPQRRRPRDGPEDQRPGRSYPQPPRAQPQHRRLPVCASRQGAGVPGVQYDERREPRHRLWPHHRPARRQPRRRCHRHQTLHQVGPLHPQQQARHLRGRL